MYGKVTEFIDVKCGWCGKGIRDYASNHRKSKYSQFYCSYKCAGMGRAYQMGRAYHVSVALGGRLLKNPSKFKHGKKNRDAEYYRKNLESIRAKIRKYYENNYLDIIQKRKDKDRKIREEVVTAYGGKCECCGESMIEFLTIDHINGDGFLHRRKVGKGRRIYADLLRAGCPKDNYRLLCFNCNITRGFYGYCPHHPEDKQELSHGPLNPGRKRTVRRLTDFQQHRKNFKCLDPREIGMELDSKDRWRVPMPTEAIKSLSMPDMKVRKAK